MRDLKRNTVGSNAPSAKIKERMINDLSSYSSETILLIDLKGKINFATDSAENVLGIKRENLVGKSIYRFSWGKKFLPPEHLGSIKSPIYNKSLQFELVDKRNGSKLIELSCFHHKKSRSKEKEIVLRFRINDKKIKNERTDNNNIDKYDLLYSNINLGMIEVDNNQNVLFVSKGFERISGYTEAELKGKHAPSILLDDEKQKQINSDQRKNRLRGKEGFYEIIIKSKHMGHRNWIVSGTPIYDKNGKIKGSIGIHWDITETKKFESKLLFEKIQKERQLIEERLQAEEKQRASISRDLHDGIGQMLVYLGLYVKLLKEKARVNKKDLEKAETTIQQLIDETRILSRTLSTPAIKELGLRDAIIELINSFGILKNPVFNVKVYNGSDPANLQYEQKIMVYRIIQELCNNTFKYAKASLVKLNITHSKNKLNLHYKDNGKGFDPKKNKKGIGLRSILSRVEYYEGKFELNTSLNKGTEVMINLPLN